MEVYISGRIFKNIKRKMVLVIQKNLTVAINK